MKKGYFCDEVLRSLTGGNYAVSEFKFERRDVAAHINAGIAYVVKANFFENYKLGDKGWIDTGFTTTYEDVPVLYSNSQALYYSDLPTIPISLEHGLGIVEVAPMKDERSAFIPLAMGTAGLYKNLPSENLYNEVGYRQQGKRIYYKNLLSGNCAVDFGVLIIMVASTLDLSMDDELPFPEDYYTQVRDSVIAAMVPASAVKQDAVVDSNPSTK